jgi:hypothetical protein
MQVAHQGFRTGLTLARDGGCGCGERDADDGEEGDDLGEHVVWCRLLRRVSLDVCSGLEERRTVVVWSVGARVYMKTELRSMLGVVTRRKEGR